MGKHTKPCIRGYKRPKRLAHRQHLVKPVERFVGVFKKYRDPIHVLVEIPNDFPGEVPTVACLNVCSAKELRWLAAQVKLIAAGRPLHTVEALPTFFPHP